MKAIIFFVFLLFFYNSCDRNDGIMVRNEIEPNDGVEYAQYIDSRVLIKAKLDSGDVDYYNISPTNGFVMDLSVFYDGDIRFEILDENAQNTILEIDAKELVSLKGNMEIKDLVLDGERYFFRLTSNGEASYDIRLDFKNDYMYKNEVEDNNDFYSANTIDYPNQIIRGYFFKDNNINDKIDSNIRPYLKNENIIDIDFYRIENETDIDASIEIVAKYKRDAHILLFDGDYKYIKESKNILTTDFFSGDKYYLALVFYGDKYLAEGYDLYYNFSN